MTLKSGSGQIERSHLPSDSKTYSKQAFSLLMSLSNIKKVQFDFRIIYANLSAQNKIPEHNRIKLPATCCSQRFSCSIETIVAYTNSISLSPIISKHCGPCCATGLVSSVSAYLNMETGFYGSGAADEPTNLITSSSTAGSAPGSCPQFSSLVQYRFRCAHAARRPTKMK